MSETTIEQYTLPNTLHQIEIVTSSSVGKYLKMGSSGLITTIANGTEEYGEVEKPVLSKIKEWSIRNLKL